MPVENNNDYVKRLCEISYVKWGLKNALVIRFSKDKQYPDKIFQISIF